MRTTPMAGVPGSSQETSFSNPLDYNATAAEQKALEKEAEFMDEAPPPSYNASTSFPALPPQPRQVCMIRVAIGVMPGAGMLPRIGFYSNPWLFEQTIILYSHIIMSSGTL